MSEKYKISATLLRRIFEEVDGRIQFTKNHFRDLYRHVEQLRGMNLNEFQFYSKNIAKNQSCKAFMMIECKRCKRKFRIEIQQSEIKSALQNEIENPDEHMAILEFSLCVNGPALSSCSSCKFEIDENNNNEGCQCNEKVERLEEKVEELWRIIEDLKIKIDGDGGNISNGNSLRILNSTVLNNFSSFSNFSNLSSLYGEPQFHHSTPFADADSD